MHKVKTEELQQVVTPPAAENLFEVPSFADLNSTSFQQLVSQQACEGNTCPSSIYQITNI